jgi:hypothetical protein
MLNDISPYDIPNLMEANSKKVMPQSFLEEIEVQKICLNIYLGESLCMLKVYAPLRYNDFLKQLQERGYLDTN